MKGRSSEEWEILIKNAIRSKQTIKSWCKQHDVGEHLFYRRCHSLGYISDGKRTEKWRSYAAVAIENADSAEAFLVPVPQETISAAFMPDGKPDSDGRPAICIQNASWKIYVGDGVRKETLRDVLEVVADAKGS